MTESTTVARELSELDWNFSEADTLHTGHGIQPYPAKFPPQLPEQLIERLSQPGDLVLDCFGGSGTTALEAVRRGRRAISIDANPVATLLTRVKTTTLTRAHRDGLLELADRLLQPFPNDAPESAWRPVIPNVEKWYASHVVDELVNVRALIVELLDPGPALDLALIAFAQSATRLSYQESETRYAAVPRPIPVGAAQRRVSMEIERMLRSVPIDTEDWGTATAITADSRDSAAYPEAESVGLIVASPPYPNAYDYHLYQRFRIFWLAEDPRVLRKVEIGSHLRNQARREPVADYESDMALVLKNAFSSLKPSRFAAFVVGTGVHRGEVYETGDRLVDLAGSVGFEHVVTLERVLPANRRSVTVAGRRLKRESVVLLRRT